jgi:hypothetical protein
MKTYGTVDVRVVYIHVFLTLKLVGEGQSASRPGRFTPGERVLGIHWIGGWVGLTAGLEDMEKWKFLTLPELEIDPSVVDPVASRYTD